MSKFRLYTDLVDYGTPEPKPEPKVKPNQELQDTLTNGTARRYFLENFYPTIGGIDDYDITQNQHEEETERTTKRLQDERRKQEENISFYDW